MAPYQASSKYVQQVSKWVSTWVERCHVSTPRTLHSSALLGPSTQTHSHSVRRWRELAYLLTYVITHVRTCALTYFYQGLEAIPGSLEMRPSAAHPDCPVGLSLVQYNNPSIPQQAVAA